MNRSGNVVIAQGGGPTAVINASLYGMVRESTRQLSASSKIWGARGGILGVLQRRWLDLRQPSVRLWKSIAVSPGAALGSCRKMLSAQEAMEAVFVLRNEDVRHFFYIGGNDSMDTALKMSEAALALHYEMTCCGIPKTIDNDLPGTDHCPGFGSAARFIAQSVVDLGMDIRALPTPVSILEVMGRDAGWLTAATLLGRKEADDAPHLIYVPERPLGRESLLRDVQRVYDRQGWVVVAVSEGIKDETGESWAVSRSPQTVDGFGHKLPGDVATRLAGLVTSELGLRARSEKPGLLGRSCALMASSLDRREAREVGRFGFSWAIKGNTGFMVSIKREDSAAYRVEYGAVPLNTVANLTRLLPPEYVSGDGNDIKEEYRAYVEPLIGDPLRRYARLDSRQSGAATA
jgi:6-phosphofructokinase 1